MEIRHILAAADESDAGRQAVRTAIDLASRTYARVTVLRVSAVEASRRRVSVGGGSENEVDQTAERYLRRWLAADVLSPAENATVEAATATGIPGVEICRFAEQNHVDLVVLGRKQHSTMMRLLLGDTADAVARRSRVPCLFTPPRSGEVGRILVALNGSERGMNVLTEACDLAKNTRAELLALTVEPGLGEEPLKIVPDIPITRSLSLEKVVRQVLAQKGMQDTPLAIRRGDIVERVLAELQETGADILAIGYHRGGPPGVLEAGSTARRLAHVAPCAVLTIPL
jgi:nucleotide-binding universal stress UspA family protein